MDLISVLVMFHFGVAMESDLFFIWAGRFYIRMVNFLLANTIILIGSIFPFILVSSLHNRCSTSWSQLSHYWSQLSHYYLLHHAKFLSDSNFATCHFIWFIFCLYLFVHYDTLACSFTFCCCVEFISCGCFSLLRRFLWLLPEKSSLMSISAHFELEFLLLMSWW